MDCFDSQYHCDYNIQQHNEIGEYDFSTFSIHNITFPSLFTDIRKSQLDIEHNNNNNNRIAIF